MTARPPWFALLVPAFLLGAGCSKPATSRPDPELLARIGSREIRLPEFRDAMARRAVGDDPGAREALLEELIRSASLVEKARQLGLDQDPGLRRSWENMLVAKLRETGLEPLMTKAAPTPDQIKARYETNQAAYSEPAMRRGAMLFLEVPAKASAEQKARTRARLEEARAKALSLTNGRAIPGFGALAVEYSEDQPTRYRGGDIGWVRAGRGDSRFDPAVLEALFGLQDPGTVSGVIDTPRGLYLVRLAEVRPARVKALPEVRPSLEHALLVENRRRIEEEWLRTMTNGVPVERFVPSLAAIPVLTTNRPGAAAAPPPVP